VDDRHLLSAHVDGDRVLDVGALHRTLDRRLTHLAHLRAGQRLALLLVVGGDHHLTLRRLDRHFPLTGDVDLRRVLRGDGNKGNGHGDEDGGEHLHDSSFGLARAGRRGAAIARQ
jgi:hypothetical protein